MEPLTKLGNQPLMWLVELGESFKNFIIALYFIIRGKVEKKEFVTG